MPLSVGTRLGPYEVVGALGAGGMGEVYRATDTRLKRQVAIKILPAALSAQPLSTVSGGDQLARFQREAEVLASLNHPHIAAVYGLEDTESGKALVMELVEGPTLADRIAQGTDSRRRSPVHRAPDRRGTGSGPRAGHRASRSEAHEHQGARRMGPSRCWTLDWRSSQRIEPPIETNRDSRRPWRVTQ